MGGRLEGKLGPFRITVAGSIGLSLGFILAGFTSTLWWIFLTFRVIMGAGNGFGYAKPIPELSKRTMKWAVRKRGPGPLCASTAASAAAQALSKGLRTIFGRHLDISGSRAPDHRGAEQGRSPLKACAAGP